MALLARLLFGDGVAFKVILIALLARKPHQTEGEEAPRNAEG